MDPPLSKRQVILNSKQAFNSSGAVSTSSENTGPTLRHARDMHGRSSKVRKRKRAPPLELRAPFQEKRVKVPIPQLLKIRGSHPPRPARQVERRALSSQQSINSLRSNEPWPQRSSTSRSERRNHLSLLSPTRNLHNPRLTVWTRRFRILDLWGPQCLGRLPPPLGLAWRGPRRVL